MRLDPDEPRSPAGDRFVLSKGHAAPLLYAVWAELGVVKREELTRLRSLASDLEGHPTPSPRRRRRRTARWPPARRTATRSCGSARPIAASLLSTAT